MSFSCKVVEPTAKLPTKVGATTSLKGQAKGPHHLHDCVNKLLIWVKHGASEELDDPSIHVVRCDGGPCVIASIHRDPYI